MQKCDCEYGCDPRTGHCLRCPAGHSGVLCEQGCPKGTWGEKCMNKCNCGKNGECDNVDGTCHCKSGFDGVRCDHGMRARLFLGVSKINFVKWSVTELKNGKEKFVGFSKISLHCNQIFVAFHRVK